MSRTPQILTQRSQTSSIQQLLTSLNQSNRQNFLLDRHNNATINTDRTYIRNASNESSPDKDSLINLLKNQIQFKVPWKSSGLKHEQGRIKRLNHKYEMNNWEISRIQLSKRSYDYPKAYKGIKIPQKGRQFSNPSDKDKDGHLPYLYQNDSKKYESLKEKLSLTPFKVTNSVRHDYFGFGKQKYLSKQRFQNQSQILQNKKKTYELSLL